MFEVLLRSLTFIDFWYQIYAQFETTEISSDILKTHDITWEPFLWKKRKSLHAISLLIGKHNEDIEIFYFPYNFAWVDVVSIDVLNFVKGKHTFL